MRRRAPYQPPKVAPLKIIQRFTPLGFDHLLSEVREAAERGQRVRVCRWRMPFFYIVRNGPLFLTLPAEGSPIGSFESVAAAIMAGDRHAEADDGRDLGHDDQPNGAA